jgi:hypothetical protein
MKPFNYRIKRIWNGWIVRENAPNSVEQYFSRLENFVTRVICEEIAALDHLAGDDEWRKKFNGSEAGVLFELNGFDEAEAATAKAARGLINE